MVFVKNGQHLKPALKTWIFLNCTRTMLHFYLAALSTKRTSFSRFFDRSTANWRTTLEDLCGCLLTGQVVDRRRDWGLNRLLDVFWSVINAFGFL